MKFDAALLTPELKHVPARARELERVGYDGTFSFEGPHEPFMPLLLAAEHTERLEVATGLAIALARNPMVVANLAWDLHAFSEGRFILGLGSQIKPHIERRYSSQWSRPVARMREFVLALKAIFARWNEGEPLRFEGEFYTHTLMPPVFDPGPNPHGRPPIVLGGVGSKMVRVAGEVADGLVVHPFHSQRSLRTVTLPAIEEGLARTERTREGFILACQTLVITGKDEESQRRALEATRAQIAFYASTPAYECVLDAEGWSELQPELQAMTRAGRWKEMTSLVTDEMIDVFALRGTPREVAHALHDRYGTIAERIAFASPYPLDPECEAEILETYRGLEADARAAAPSEPVE